jgi:hypothetical protein
MSPALGLPTMEFEQHVAGDNVWLHGRNTDASQELIACVSHALSYEVLESEDLVGQAMFAELTDAAARKPDDLTVVILGGRGGQALHRLLGEKAKTSEIDDLLGRLNVFTQDALAPMRMDNAFSFVRDFERLLGDAFFKKVKSFTSMQTDADDLESGLLSFLDQLES